MKRVVIFISGRGSNMTAIINSTKNGILRNICEIAAVISNKPDAPGLVTAESLGVTTHVVPSRGVDPHEYTRQLINVTAQYKPDLIILAGYMKILDPAFIDVFRGRIINIHPADTACHQGLHAYEWAYEQGLDTTYITVHYVDESLDGGDVIEKRPVDLRGAQTLDEVEKRGLAVEHQFYSEMIADVLKSDRV